MNRESLILVLCVCGFTLTSCGSKNGSDVKKLRDDLDAAKAENE